MGKELRYRLNSVEVLLRLLKEINLLVSSYDMAVGICICNSALTLFNDIINTFSKVSSAGVSITGPIENGVCHSIASFHGAFIAASI